LSGIFSPNFISINTAYLIFGILSALFISIAYLRSKGKFKFINPGIIGLAIVVLTGYIQVFRRTDSNRPDHIINCNDTILYYTVTIISQPQEKENSWKAEAEVNWIQVKGGEPKQGSGKVLLYFSKHDFQNPFQYGDKLVVRGSPTLIKGPANPGEFDYKQFLAYRKIYHQHFLRKGSALLTDHESPSVIIEYSICARQWADKVIERNVDGSREQATTSALVLGLMDGLDTELIGAYAATGSLHVLSVSGLHVGIIYWLLLLLFKPLEKTTRGKWALAILSVVILWAYAFVTGLSPSVLRAVTMFAFVAIAKPWNQRTNIYNTLAVSAFCLLFYEPYLMMSVGFQLSYLAVIGIVYLQPFLSRVWEPKQWLWNNVWQIVCVSIAAQLATVSIGLLYFHQFPVYFLVANLFVIPISFIVLIIGIVLIALGAVPSIALVVGILLTWSVKLLNGCVIQMEKLPFSLIDNVNITAIQCWLLMVLIISIVLMLEHRAYKAGVIASLCVILFALVQWNQFINDKGETTLTIYGINGHTALDVIENGQAYFYADSLLASDPNNVRFHIGPHRLKCGVRSVSSIDIVTTHFKGCRLIVWHDKTILQIENDKFEFPLSLVPNYVIIGNNAIKSLNNISHLKSSVLILDSSNSFYFADRILKQAQHTSTKIYSVLHQGAYIDKLSQNETGRVSR
jgi:competence protein ComEC